MGLFGRKFDDFEEWKEFLGKRINNAKTIGINEETITE